MNLTVTIDSVNRTSYVNWPSFKKEDILNSQVDTCEFETKKYGTKTWKPNVGGEIVITDDGTKVFGGVIMRVEETIEGALISYRVECKDYTHYLDRALVVERYTDMTVNEIIADINTNYLSGFTVANVVCDIFVSSLTFDRITVNRCLQTLAEKTNYSWYVDYDKDIHFFAKNTEISPFNLDDTGGKYVFSSLIIKEDLSQIRNRVYVRGGEVPAASRSDNLTGDGTKVSFPLAYKFASLPTVTVGGVSKTVGIEFLNTTGYDCYWNYNEKYIRFDAAPAAAAAIVVTGNPLMPILVQVEDAGSIDVYGEFEHSIVDKTIKTNDEARQYGYSQLAAYAASVKEGQFITYTSGLRSGQTITVQSNIRGTNETFLIQRVGLSMRTPTEGIWVVELATLRTLNIIEFLQKLLISQDRLGLVGENEVVTLEMSRTDNQGIDIAESISKDPFGAGVAPDFVLGEYCPTSHTDVKREGYLGSSLKVY
jgi:hypothetical protein